ncbi:ornithine carbamoyltransferase [bacterium]|nr:ornithine carbamoyltransferase [bacterium]
MNKDFLAITDCSADELHDLIRLAMDLKKMKHRKEIGAPLKGKTLAMIFQKPSARTRVSFETGMYLLGGHALYLGPAEVGLGKRESAADVARVLSRFNDGIMARLFEHQLIVDLAKFATVPVVNGLTDFNHPCQVMGDLMTIEEHLGRSTDFQITYIGDGNNMVHSWLNAAARLPFTLHLAIPEGYDPDPGVMKRAVDAGISEIRVFRDPAEASKHADILYTDVWASMGQESEANKRKKDFEGYQVNDTIVQCAKPGVKVMHCLPAHRGDEITDSVMDGSHAIVFDEAENRMHMQNAILIRLMADKG